MKCNNCVRIAYGWANPGKALIRYLLSSWLTMLWMTGITTGAIAQNCSIGLPHGASWHGVCDNAQLKAGDPVFLCWGWNGKGDIKRIEISVVQTSGFRDNINCPVVNESVYYKKVECDNYNDDTRQICEDIMLCPRSGSFEVSISVGLRGNAFKKCPRQRETIVLHFTILPDLGIPVPATSLLVPVCPGRNTAIKVDDKPAGQNGVDWYNAISCLPTDPTSSVPEKTGYEYPVNIPVGQVVLKYPAYFNEVVKAYGTYRLGVDPVYTNKSCRIHGARLPNSVIAIPLNTSLPTVPIYRTVCDDKPLTFQIENLGGQYTGVYWYTEASGGVPIHDGFTYTRPFPANYTILYTAYYKKVGDCEDVSSIKSPVVVVNLKSISNAATSNGAVKPLVKTVKITDYRDVSSALNCNEPGQEDKYWVDLENDAIGQQISTLESAIETAINALNITGGAIEFKANITESYWQAYDNSSGSFVQNGIYLDQAPQKIVCSDYICAAGSTATRRYEKIGKITFSYSYTNPITGEQVKQSDLFCGTRLLAILDINSVHPQQTDDEKCEALTMADIQKYSTDVQGLLVGCDNYQLISACPDKVYAVGPTDAEVSMMYVAKGGLPIPFVNPFKSISWNPSGGLSSATDIRPTISYASLPPAGSNFTKYTGTIVFKDNKTANHCTIFYRCDACGSVVPPIELGDILKTP